MVSLVVTPEDFGIEFGPGLVSGRRLIAAQRKRMAGRANADDWFALFHKITDDTKLFGRRCAAANADQQQVGVVDRLDSREIVAVFRVGKDVRTDGSPCTRTVWRMRATSAWSGIPVRRSASQRAGVDRCGSGTGFRPILDRK